MYTQDEREDAEQVEREEKEMIIPPVLKPENIKRLVDIGNRLYILNMIDHWTGDDRREYIKLTAEREKLRRGNEQSESPYSL